MKEGVINFKFIFDCSHTHKEGAISKFPSLPSSLMEPTEKLPLLLRIEKSNLGAFHVNHFDFAFIEQFYSIDRVR